MWRRGQDGITAVKDSVPSGHWGEVVGIGNMAKLAEMTIGGFLSAESQGGLGRCQVSSELISPHCPYLA